MISLVKKSNWPTLGAANLNLTTLHNERTNVNQQITKSEARSIANNSAAPLQRINYATEKIGPNLLGVYKDNPTPDLSKQNYSSLAKVQMGYHAVDFLPQNYNALGQVARLQDEFKSGLFVNYVV